MKDEFQELVKAIGDQFQKLTEKFNIEEMSVEIISKRKRPCPGDNFHYAGFVTWKSKPGVKVTLTIKK